MKNLFSMLLLVLLSVFAPEGVAQTATDDLTRQRAALTEVPETVLNTELQLLGAKTLKLSEYSGKVVILNLFATWCGPCRLESPDLARLHEEFKDRGVVVIELSTENPEFSRESVREWVWEYRLPYPVGWVTRDFALTLMQTRSSIPQTFIITRDGRILKRFIGYNPTMTSKQLREAVQEALR